MKKNLILASAAFVFAIGSAFASMFVVAENVYVKAQFGSTSSPVVCLDTQVQCTQSTDFPCSVSVNLIGGGSQTATTGTSRIPYRVACATPLGNTFAGTQSSPISGDNRPDRIIQE